jgi:hypothetical protein
MPTAKKTPLGPGTLTLGDVGSPIDISCQVINAVVEWDKDKDDDVTVLCGDVVAGSTTYTAQITGELFQDVDDPAGILATSWTQKGTEIAFSFVPNTAAGTECEGTLILDPIDFGGDEAKANMTSDFTWAIVGEPTLTIGTGGAAADATTRTRTRATADV